MEARGWAVHRVTAARVSQHGACWSPVMSWWYALLRYLWDLEGSRPAPYLLLDTPLLLLVEGVTAAELGLSVLQFPGLVGGEQSLS